MLTRAHTAAAAAFTAVLALTACSSGGTGEQADLVVYSGRSETLVAPVIEQFEASSGTTVDVRYGDTAELAAQLLEEGDRSPADVFFAQDAGALQVLEDEGLTSDLAPAQLDLVPAKFRSADGQWVGTSGRARVIVYNTELVDETDVPKSVFDLTDPTWRGQVGIAPTNASFQAFVTAMRKTVGEAQTKKWLEEMQANGAQSFENNAAVLDAVDAGTVSLGLVNHYYLYEKAEEVGEENLKAANAAFEAGDPGNLVNVAGLAVLDDENTTAAQFVDYMLSDSGQQFFATQTAEYPLVDGVKQRDGLTPLSKVDGPDLTLDQLSDLRGTQELLLQVGLI